MYLAMSNLVSLSHVYLTSSVSVGAQRIRVRSERLAQKSTSQYNSLQKAGGIEGRTIFTTTHAVVSNLLESVQENVPRRAQANRIRQGKVGIRGRTPFTVAIAICII